VRPVYLSGLDWITLAWQEPGPDDDSNRIKIWTHLKQSEAGPQFVSDPHTVKITVRVQKTSLLNAWWGKIKANYLSAAQYVPFVRYFWNSTYLITLNVILLLISSSLVAFGISRFTWPGRDLVFLLILGTMMLPEQVTMVPTFLVWKNLGLYNTLTPLWLGSAFGSAVNIFLLRQFMKGIPRDVEDAARIDGCGFLRVYWHIMLPLVRPALAAIGLMTAVAIWNDFKGPLLYLADQRLYPLSFGLYAFTITVSSSPAQTMAASVLTALPIITLFFFAQRHFIRGVTLTGVRG
jgi:multiple sugar transport system permease protein